MIERPKIDPENAKLIVEMWRQSIDVTKHFTEMSERTRRMGMTGAIGGVALAITLLTQFTSAKLSFVYDGFEYGIHAAGPIVFASAVVVYVTRLIDVDLYHRMLRGSVAYTQDLERSDEFKAIVSTKRGLAEYISFHSRAKRSVSDDDASAELPPKKTSAEHKLRRFYSISILVLIATGTLLLLTTAMSVKHEDIEIINQTVTRPRT